MSDQVTILPIKMTDLPAVTEVHLAAFSDRALATLGAEAIQRYYAGILSDHPDTFHLKAVQGGQIIGFCFGGVFGPGGALGTFLQRHKRFLAWQVLKRPWLVVSNPLFRKRVLMAARLLLRAPQPTQSTSARPAPIFRVLAIATHPNFQGQGVGKLLMAEAEAIAKKHGYAEIGLSVDLANTQALRFYERQGWQRLEHRGVWSGGMWKQVGGPNDSH
jgi:ribosomal protein S18 acetylase RimI-like enzyme